MATGLQEAWNALVQELLKARNSWEKFKSEAMKASLDDLPIEVQKVLARVNKRAKFEIMLENLISYWRGQGGLDGLVIAVKEKKTKKVEEENDNDGARGKERESSR